MTEMIEFSWNPQDFQDLLKANEMDDAVQISLKYMRDKSARILEAGAGTGRVVKYFHDLGYSDVHGIEINQTAVEHINRNYPELKIVQGDILKMPYPDAYFDVVVSYGVVEHFPKLGVVPPLRALFRVLRRGGIAVVTVPSFNHLRRIGCCIDRILEFVMPRRNNCLRMLLCKEPLPKRNSKGFLYHVHPQFGEFFEYRLTPREFVRACRDGGFEVIASYPIAHIDGMYHLFGPSLVKFERWQFYPSLLGSFLNRVFKVVPFLHNHMHLCVLRK